MSGIVLYGAGKNGVFAESLLFNQGVFIKGFCDSVKKGSCVCNGGREYTILSLSDIIQKGYQVIVTIGNLSVKNEITEMLLKSNITVLPLEEFIHKSGDIVSDNRNYIAEFHITSMDDYFESAEKTLARFWAKESIFYQMFRCMDLEDVVELACGRGRHVLRYFEDAGHITLVDILEKNILYCKERFSGEDKISYYINNGYDLSGLETERYTSLFTYDAMVHFELMDIFSYLKETHRILKKGGKALFHHSNNTEDYRISFATGTNGRNYMSRDLFAHLADRAGLKVVEQHLIDWGVKELDCLTLVEKS